MFKRTKKSLLALLMLVTLLVGSSGMALAAPNVDASGRDHNHPVSLTINHRLFPHQTPVQGAVWSLYQVNVPAGVNWDLSIGAVEDSWLTLAAGPVTTDAQGRAVLAPANQGVFLARESTPDSVGLAPDFLVSLPMQIDGVWVYHQEAYPKLYEDPRFGKEKDEEFFDNLGDLRIRWIFDLEIRGGLENLMCVNLPGCDCDVDECDPAGCCDVFIRIIDNMDERVTLDQATLQVFLYNSAGDRVNLSRDAGHWNLVYEPANNRFIVEITRAGRDFLVASGLPGTLYVSFETIVSAIPCDTCTTHDPLCDDCRDATVGMLTNDGALDYGRDTNIGIHPDDRPTTTIYSLEVLKISVRDNTPLQGAVFRLYRPEDMDTVNGNRVPVAGAVPLFEVTTNANGIARFHPLVEGIFYLYEVTPPVGYVRLASAIPVEVGPGTVSQGQGYVVEISVSNSPDFELPMTGGTGTILLTIIGALLLGGAALFFVFSKKRREI